MVICHILARPPDFVIGYISMLGNILARVLDLLLVEGLPLQAAGNRGDSHEDSSNQQAVLPSSDDN